MRNIRILLACSFALAICSSCVRDDGKVIVNASDIIGLTIGGVAAHGGHDWFVDAYLNNGYPNITCFPSFIKKLRIAAIINSAYSSTPYRNTRDPNYGTPMTKIEDDIIIYGKKGPIFVNEQEVIKFGRVYAVRHAGDTIEKLIGIAGSDCIQTYNGSSMTHVTPPSMGSQEATQ